MLTSLLTQQPSTMDDTELTRDDPQSKVKLCQQDKAFRGTITDLLSIFVLFSPVPNYVVSLM